MQTLFRFRAWIRRRVRRGLPGLPLVGLLLCSALADAQPAPIAPATSSGSYTVSLPRCSGCLTYWLEERIGTGGTWLPVSSTVSYTNRPAGEYFYRAGYYYMQASAYYGSVKYSTVVRVVVSADAPRIDSLQRQLSYRYAVRRGDLNRDGRLDLLIDRTSGGTAGNGALGSVILQQQAGGRFAAVVPSSSQLKLARGWPAAAVQVLLRDVNVDGFADVLLRGVAAAVKVSGALNQIVYAPGRVLALAPLGVRALDGTLAAFAADVHDYIADPDYFRDNAPLRVYTETVWNVYCTYGSYYPDYMWLVPECYSWPTQVTTVTRDYSVFSSSAVSIWTNEAAIYSEPALRKTRLDSIEAIVEKALAVPMGGWDFGGLSGEAGSLDEPQYRRGLELFMALLGIQTANAQEVPRRANTIYVTGRRVIGWLPFLHTALEYNRSTISAYDSDDRILGNGKLVSQKNWASDVPFMMMTLGTAARASMGQGAYWTQLLAADTRYDDNLPYFPVPKPGQGRYNCNGYTHGILSATAGAASINMNGLTGGDAVVPSSAFR